MSQISILSERSAQRLTCVRFSYYRPYTIDLLNVMYGYLRAINCVNVANGLNNAKCLPADIVIVTLQRLDLIILQQEIGLL